MEAPSHITILLPSNTAINNKSKDTTIKKPLSTATATTAVTATATAPFTPATCTRTPPKLANPTPLLVFSLLRSTCVKKCQVRADSPELFVLPLAAPWWVRGGFSRQIYYGSEGPIASSRPCFVHSQKYYFCPQNCANFEKGLEYTH